MKIEVIDNDCGIWSMVTPNGGEDEFMSHNDDVGYNKHRQFVRKHYPDAKSFTLVHVDYELGIETREEVDMNTVDTCMMVSPEGVLLELDHYVFPFTHLNN